MKRSKVIGYRIGKFEGEKRENFYQRPPDTGMILKPKWENTVDKLFESKKSDDKQIKFHQSLKDLINQFPEMKGKELLKKWKNKNSEEFKSYIESTKIKNKELFFIVFKRFIDEWKEEIKGI